MPTYGYRCEGCGREIEVVQSMSDAPLTTCSECGADLRKILYPVGVQFKGSGFYSTDYRVTPKETASNGSAGEGSQPAAGEPGGAGAPAKAPAAAAPGAPAGVPASSGTKKDGAE
ncbi:MAG TPA: FmdB family zinc ribbon protein [Candidatus Acidoferrales bacterium]|nr:FmdB family zinc ribbon protein [Candidatus Acidoferrales bacterium]